MGKISSDSVSARQLCRHQGLLAVSSPLGRTISTPLASPLGFRTPEPED